MPSKREKLHRAVDALQALVCPVCRQTMALQGEAYRCVRGHSVNVNRKGCLNVLSTPSPSCYDAALFQARRRVFQAGCYDEVMKAVELLLPAGKHRLLDAGCGDGWYLNALLTRHGDWCGAGVDISKDAIFQATDQPCMALWCVGDLRRLPFADGSFTAVLDVLTPASYDEFRRVLTPDGLLIKVYPGSGYLREIRQVRGLEDYEAGQVDAYLREKASVMAQRHVQEVIPVSSELWRDFVWMTPLNQDLTNDEKEDLAQHPATTITIDLYVTAVRFV